MSDSMINAIVADLDGTLALLHSRNPYDASTCEQDAVNEPVLQVLKWAYEDGVKIIFCSGREDKHKPQTERFLAAKVGSRIENFSYDLHMRKSGDFRKDAIIKKEILDAHITPFFRVLFVLDDRSQVVDMWRKEKLTCFQVNPGPSK